MNDPLAGKEKTEEKLGKHFRAGGGKVEIKINGEVGILREGMKLEAGGGIEGRRGREKEGEGNKRKRGAEGGV